MKTTRVGRRFVKRYIRGKYDGIGPEGPSLSTPFSSIPPEGANFRSDLLALPGADESLCHAYRLGARIFAGVARTSAPDY